MNYPAEPLAIVIFLLFVVFVLGISYWFAKRAKTASGYYAAGGKIHWSVNGVAFAGDYLSAASFLGIAGMIALYGYDGFLYSIGFLAGWMLELSGFLPNQAQSETSLLGIRVMFTFIPAAFAVLSAVAVWCYTIREADVARVERELAERHAGE